MSFQFVNVLASEADGVLLECWSKYWSQPEDVIMEHNFHYRHGRYKEDRIRAVIDENEGCVIIKIHDVIRNPGMSAPGLYVIYFNGEIIIIKTSERIITFADYESKTMGIMLKVMPYKIPVGMESEGGLIKNFVLNGLRAIEIGMSKTIVKLVKVDVVFSW